MALAYCILAHKNPAQLARLLRAIAHPGNVYAVHYEKRAPHSEHEAVARLSREQPGAFLLPARAILWGRFSQIGAQMEGIRRCLEADPNWTHCITLSGQDFPLVPQAEMIAQLAAAPERSFLSFFDPFAEPVWSNLAERIGRVHLDSAALEDILGIPFFGRRLRQLCGWRDRMPVVPFAKRRLPPWLRYMGGSNHVILAREAAAYLVGDPAALRIIEWLKYSGHPDESIFQSVLCHSPFAEKLVNDDRRAICWEKAGSPNPRTLTASHLPWLREARKKGNLFARKFDPSVDDEVIHEMEKDLNL